MIGHSATTRLSKKSAQNAVSQRGSHHQSRSDLLHSITAHENSLAMEQADRTCLAFPLFSLLPKELQLMIWEYASQEFLQQRIHCIKITTTTTTFSKSYPKPRPAFTFSTPNTIPTLIATCSDSRAVFIAQTGVRPHFGTWINMSRDIIYLPDNLIPSWSPIYYHNPNSGQRDRNENHAYVAFLAHPDTKHIQNLAMPITLYDKYSNGKYSLENHNHPKQCVAMPAWNKFIIVYRSAIEAAMEKGWVRENPFACRALRDPDGSMRIGCDEKLDSLTYLYANFTEKGRKDEGSNDECSCSELWM